MAALLSRCLHQRCPSQISKRALLSSGISRLGIVSSPRTPMMQILSAKLR